MVATPVVEALNVTEQEAIPAVVPADRVHGLPVNAPVTPVTLKVTVPVGVGAPVEVPEIVTVHVED